MDHSFVKWEWLALWETLNPPVFLHVPDDEPEGEKMERSKRKRHPACEWDLQEEGIRDLKFEFSWWDGVHGVYVVSISLLEP